jgi:hypothetical protein
LHFWRKLVALALLLAVILQDFWLSAFLTFGQKSVIHTKDKIAQVVQARYQNTAGDTRRLFFPFASPWVIMEFAYYLDYRGIPVEGITRAAGGLNSVSVVTRAMTKDGPCVDYRNLICHAAATPNAGDLVIVLPDDNQSLADLTPYLAQGELLFSYEPIFPKWVYPWLRDGWLHASVTAWK